MSMNENPMNGVGTYRCRPLAQTEESHLNYQWAVQMLSICIQRYSSIHRQLMERVLT